MIPIIVRHEHERRGNSKKVRNLKKRRSRQGWSRAMTFDKNGKHSRREAAWRKNKRFSDRAQ